MSGALVLRFGGASLSTPLRVRGAAERVQWLAGQGVRIAVVVSVPSDRSDRLLRWIERIAAGRMRGMADHGVAGEGVAREVDAAGAAAEQLTASVLAASLVSLGLRAKSMRAGEVRLEGKGEFGAGTFTAIDARAIDELLRRGVIAVLTGGYVHRPDGEILMLGARGADLTAVALAEALGAACHFVVDRDKLDPTTWDGQLVHPLAARWAMERSIPVKTYSFRAPFGGAGADRTESSA